MDTNEVDLSQANIAQMSTTMKNAPTQLLEKYRLVLPANPTIIPACNRAKLQLLLVRNNFTPHAAKQGRYSPEATSVIQSEISKLTATGAICRSHSAWAACVLVMKKDGTARGCQGYRRLSTLLESDSGGLGDIASIFDGMRGATCFASIDLAAGFTQLEIHCRFLHAKNT